MVVVLPERLKVLSRDDAREQGIAGLLLGNGGTAASLMALQGTWPEMDTLVAALPVAVVAASAPATAATRRRRPARTKLFGAIDA